MTNTGFRASTGNVTPSDPQRVDLVAAPAVGAHRLDPVLQRRPQRLAVGGAAGRAADAVDLGPLARDAHAAEVGEAEDDHLGVQGGVLAAQRLDPRLVVL